MTRTSVPLLAAALLATAIAATPHPAAATWPHEPNNGNAAICTAAGEQASAAIVSDGAGGAIITWHDSRNGNYDIYAQRISAAGEALWTANGVALCTATGEQSYPEVVSDAAGGAIITWQDYRSGTNYDIYVQRISAAGVVQWTSNGVALCTATGEQSLPTIVSDGASGAVVTWVDYRSGTSYDIYARRISAAGVVQWTANGVALCTATGEQRYPTIVSDGTGGAIATWHDFRSGTNYDIYAQRISAAGAVQWTANGVAICNATDSQVYPTITPDGAGGAIVAWWDYRNGTNNVIYAQRISAAGTLQWTANGVALCTATGNQQYSTIVSDSAGGAIIAWRDYRSGTNYDIYAQRISAAGVVRWTATGVALCTATGNQYYPSITSDGANGAIVTWYDFSTGTGDIYAQRISAAGAVQWTTNGAALCTATGDQYYTAIVSDDAGGAIVTWEDYRSGTGDIYAQRIERYGQLGNPEPVITSVKDLPNDQGGFVKVSWDASYLDVDPVYGVSEYRVFRSAPVFLATSAAARRAVTDDSDVAVREGALLALASAGATVYWEYVGTQAAEAFAGYSRVVATTSDSIAGSNPRTLFMVEARASTSVSADRWASFPDSGYSVDNLAPLAPAPFTGQYANGTTTMYWAVNPAADLAEYRLYRGSTADFVPGPANLVVAQSDIGYVDAAGAAFYYKLCAVDVHGNVSGFSTLLPSGTVDVPGSALPRAVFLASPAPNPARGATTLRFGLPRAAAVELALYDQQGRRVRALLAGTQPAGEHAIAWNGADDSGCALPAGLYFVRLATEGRTFVSRLAVIR